MLKKIATTSCVICLALFIAACSGGDTQADEGVSEEPTVQENEADDFMDEPIEAEAEQPAQEAEESGEQDDSAEIAGEDEDFE